jgi:hypothetical protein
LNVTRSSPRRAWLVRCARAAAVLSAPALGVNVLGLLATPAGAGPALPGAGPRPWSRRETRPTLDPALFVGKAAAAHRVAREIPDVIDQLYCYCHCDKTVGHLTLLSCYTDGHAAT